MFFLLVLRLFYNFYLNFLSLFIFLFFAIYEVGFCFVLPFFFEGRGGASTESRLLDFFFL